MNRLGFVLLMWLGCISCIRENVGESIQYVQPGDRLPDFTVELSDGTILSRHSLVGKVSVLVFSIRNVRIVSGSFRLFRNCMSITGRMPVWKSSVSVGKRRLMRWPCIGGSTS